ncbi:hypothetical protein [Vibrio coralliilyticus]|uniref:hypothetical protein n=1 Tax=Vibrio coralliilyticus TaxID=190893 RepID=UPI000C167A71|nr:hypothetical protein [Vibrio coralliilyticus]
MQTVITDLIICLGLALTFIKLVRLKHDIACNVYTLRILKSTVLSLIMGAYLHTLDMGSLIYVFVPLTATASYFSFFVLVHRESKKLVVVPYPLNRSKVAIHLSEVNRTFDRDTYQQLTVLLSKLKQHDIEVVTLTSPMFVKDGQLRNMALFKRMLKPHIKTLRVECVPWYQRMLPTVSLVYFKYIKKAPIFKNTSTSHWVRFALTLNSVEFQKL